MSAIILTHEALAEIDWQIYKPSEDKPGYLTFVRCMTLQEFNDAIRTKMPKALAERLDYWGSSNAVYKKDGMKDSLSGPEKDSDTTMTRLLIQWEPGTSEGYYVHVYASTPKAPVLRCVWMAKTFEAQAAIALSLCLQCWIGNDGRAMRHATAEIVGKMTFA